MTQYQKLLEKFEANPKSLKVDKIIKILETEGFYRGGGVGSHNLYKKGQFSVNFPIHNGDCKEIYKKKALKEYLKMKHSNNF